MWLQGTKLHTITFPDSDAFDVTFEQRRQVLRACSLARSLARWFQLSHHRCTTAPKATEAGAAALTVPYGVKLFVPITIKLVNLLLQRYGPGAEHHKPSIIVSDSLSQAGVLAGEILNVPVVVNIPTTPICTCVE